MLPAKESDPLARAARGLPVYGELPLRQLLSAPIGGKISWSFLDLIWVSFGVHILLLVMFAVMGESWSLHNKNKIDLDAPIIWADLKVGAGGGNVNKATE